MLTPGGVAVLDDLTPGPPGPDPVREFWLGHPDLAATELLTKLWGLKEAHPHLTYAKFHRH